MKPQLSPCTVGLRLGFTYTCRLHTDLLLCEVEFSIVMVLHYLYRAAVSALFSLVVLVITYCAVKSHFILLFEQIKKEKKKKVVACSALSLLAVMGPRTWVQRQGQRPEFQREGLGLTTGGVSSGYC